jgi:hypothetical protein
MYTQIWNKYLPIIKILLKRSSSGDQVFDLNVSDFKKSGASRKAGYKFAIQFSKGRVDNVISTSEFAKDLAAVLLEDKFIKELFTQNDYHIAMNAKFQLSIKFISSAPVEVEEAEAVDASTVA